MDIQSIGMFFALACIIIGILVILLNAKYESNYQFECSHCKKKFVTKWTKFILAIHSGTEYKLICPHCNKKDFCKRKEKTK